MARFLLKVAAIDAIMIGKSIMNRQKILIVDDNAVVIKALAMKLSASGYEVVTALEASEAISAARKEKPDLILLDINFPEDIGVAWDGFKIIAWLQRVEEAKGTPIIVISGGDAAKFQDRSIQSGAIAYFQKPIDNEKLIAVIEKALAEKPAKV
jgi:CheY-like chemotaxis protein